MRDATKMMVKITLLCFVSVVGIAIVAVLA